MTDGQSDVQSSGLRSRPNLGRYENLIPKEKITPFPKLEPQTTVPEKHPFNLTLLLAILALLISLVSLYLSLSKAPPVTPEHDMSSVAQEIRALKSKRVVIQMDTSQPVIIGGDIKLHFTNQSIYVPFTIPIKGTLKGIDKRTGAPVSIDVDQTLLTSAEIASFPELNSQFYAPSNVSATVVVNTTLGDIMGAELDRIADKLTR